jgi:hypothetical protein
MLDWRGVEGTYDGCADASVCRFGMAERFADLDMRSPRKSVDRTPNVATRRSVTTNPPNPPSPSRFRLGGFFRSQSQSYPRPHPQSQSHSHTQSRTSKADIAQPPLVRKKQKSRNLG